ncbi:MAG TPA: methyltransferase domain-containing protein [Terriglobales bacterium]|nr:methyltransferase domain-containing protein [Terriglobales bacterium]
MAKNNEARLYTAKFYRELAFAQDSAREVLPIIFEALKPSSVADIGCGTGHWLAAVRELGVEDIFGIDGPWVSKTQLVIPAQRFSARDLAAPLKLGRRFDLALSFEVAEHLPESAARTFVKSLCDAADVIAFSAAIPGQGGRHHLNEQWPIYWAKVFEEFSYDCFDYLRPRIWNNPHIAWYYAQNSLIFVCSGTSHPFGQSVQPMSLVHPALWSAEVARSKHPGKLLERLVKSLLGS